ncbi:synaptosomal-associated protein 47 isoform X2 [Strongylocentrotus purpuratus]|nr:synaptosomal-associated protein 47 isoform X2 [Strongylocentrotus purpuratus]XP_789878.1 synaptosomal-associated protein 47 isoform X2 [Strongylocentrotus purpuratus]|eukprot:XP_789878.1 PREDICTED: synaptosomal-associated protein 47 isoform X2 [Strongylocentrotus purpuratus]
MAQRGLGDLPVIRRWNVTYYQEDDKKWLKGDLVLSSLSLSFQELASERIHLTVDLESITDVKLERAWTGYKSLVVLVGSRKLWFSSFTNSQCVRKVLQHFIKETLFVSRHVGGTAPTGSGGGGGSSKLGRELLSIAHDSERTLSGAASQLVTQGEQIDDGFKTMDLIQRDLGIARHNIAYLESWLGHWHVRINDLQPPVSQRSSQNQPINENQEFPVIYKLKKSEEESGLLVISPDGIAVRNANEERTVLQFTYREISVINVSTPWTFTITRRMMGKPDITCQVTSAKVISILKVMGSKVKEKIEYDEPDSVDFISQEALGESVSNKKRLLFSQDSRGDPEGFQDRVQLDGGQQQSQLTCTSDAVITESEAAELSNVMRDVKSLALGIGNELDVQKEKISVLTDDVSEVTEDVRMNNKRMQKLL